MSSQQVMNSSRATPAALEISEAYVIDTENQIFKQIYNGQMSIPQKPIKIELKVTDHQEPDNVKLAIREKILLQRRLAYINKSIGKKAASAMGKLQTEKDQKEQENPEVYKKKMKQIRRKEKEMKQEFEKIKSDITAKKLTKIQEQNKMHRQRKVQINEQRKRDLSQKINKIKQRTNKRQEQDQQQKRKIQSLFKTQTIHSRLLRQQQIYEAQKVEERNKKLQELKKQHQSISQLQIVKHQQKFLQHQKQKQIDRLKERQQFLSRKYNAPYQSIYYKKVKGEKQKPRDTSFDDAMSKRQKIKQFSQLLKIKYKPEVSPRLMKQSSLRIQKQTQQLQEIRRKQSTQGRKKGLQYLSYIRSLPKATNKTITQTPSVTTQHKYQNYLVHSARGDSSWQQYKSKSKAVDPQANIQQFLSYTHAFEQKLRLNEQKSRILKQYKTEQIDQKYIDLINAKLQFYNSNKD